MYNLNSGVRALLEKRTEWVLATESDGNPNCIPVFFTKVLSDGTLAIGDAFMNKTLKNIEKNDRIAISVFEMPPQGYQIKGIAKYVTSGSVVEAMNAAASAFGLACKGALIVEINEVYVTSPGPDVGKKI